MKKRFLSVLACILAAVLCVGIFGETTTFAKGKTDASTVTGKVMKLTKKSKATNEEMIRGYNRFSIKTLRETLANEEDGKNVMISPASLMFALDMAAVGAKGKTYSQMAALIRKGATKRDLVTFAKDYRKTLEDSGLIDIANSIWINENNLRGNNVQINEAYLNLLRKHFKAAAASREFSDTVKDEINAWISEKTKGMIPKTLDKLDDNTIMLIINAMAFEGKWKNEYKEYQINEDGKFTNYAGEVETAKMLSSEEDYYFETENEKGFMKMYEGDKYAFMAILPLDKEISINDYVKGLPDDVETGTRILIDDGLIEMKVVSKTSTEINCKVINGGPVSSHKGINVPGVFLSLPFLNDRDKNDLKFGVEQDIDFVAASFTRNANI